MKKGPTEAKLIFQGMSGTEMDDVQITMEIDVKCNFR